IKFDFDDEKQKQTVKMVERLIRDPESKLYHNKDLDNYGIQNGDIYAVFNAKIATVINGEFDHSTLIYEAIYKELQQKFSNRERSDVIKFEERLDKKVKNILTFINNSIAEHLK